MANGFIGFSMPPNAEQMIRSRLKHKGDMGRVMRAAVYQMLSMNYTDMHSWIEDGYKKEMLWLEENKPNANKDAKEVNDE
jgi:hypothetical protein